MPWSPATVVEASAHRVQRPSVADAAGIPAVVVANPGFDDQARTMGRDAGLPALQVAVYPDPFDLETDAQLGEKTRKIVVPQVIVALTKAATAPTVVAEETRQQGDCVHRHDRQRSASISNRGWSDGTSITPPTQARVEELIKCTRVHARRRDRRAASGESSRHAVEHRCEWRHGRCSSRALADPHRGRTSNSRSGLHYTNNSTGTHSFTNFFWINGPIARQLGIDYGQGLMAHPDQRGPRPRYEPHRAEHCGAENQGNPDGQLR